jgi:ribosome-binding ATPase YchF (GTP1/OBG family)
VRTGATAPQAAGVIHSDLEKGFIRAETITYEDLVACGSMAEARSQGKLRLEGKNYLVQEGDILHIRFNL